jgi:endonuclease/exonuclease/phosphatase family metal-dependent hydrolase
MKSDFISFSIATCNVLYQAYYTQYVTSEPLTIKQRCSYFRKALHDQMALSSADIICFQEWPYNPGQLRPQFEMEKLIIDNTAITKKEYFEDTATIQPRTFMAALKKAFPPDNYYYVMDSCAQKDGVLTLINKEKFTLEAYEFYTFTPNKKMLTTIVSYKGGKKHLGIINAHIPFRRSQEMPEAFEIMHTKMKCYPKKYTWLICGDFNYTVLKGTSVLDKDRYHTLKHYFRGMKSNADYHVQPTSTSGEKNFNLNDFIFFNYHHLTPQKLSIYPEDYIQLLRHTRYANEKYFSDHAVVRMKFLWDSFKKTE